MASDEDYMAFLNKANQDAEEGQAAAASSAQSAGQQRTFKTQDEGSKLPKSIADALKDAFYVSEADEPFKGVSLKWKGEGGLPDEGECCLNISLLSWSRGFWLYGKDGGKGLIRG